MMRWIAAALPLCLVLSGCQSTTPVEEYGFLALLGRDTVSIERVSRYEDRIETEEVDRFPEVRQRLTTVRLNPDGSPRHLDMRIRIPSADDEAARRRRVEAEFRGDTVRVKLSDGNDSRTIAMATNGLLTVPHVPQMYSLLELYFSAALRRAAAEGLAPGSTLTTHQFYPDREFSSYPVPMHRGYVKPLGNDTVEIQHNWLAGTGVAVVDSSGRMLSYDGMRTTYRVTVTRLAEPPVVHPIGERFAAAERERGPVTALSPRDTVRASIAEASFLVDYSRPHQRGRTLLGDVIPYDKVWRTGANKATHFSTSVPIQLGGIALSPGTYTLWTVPRRDGAMLIVNRQTEQWGTGYGPAYDMGRTMLEVSQVTDPAEQFTIAIDSTGSRSGVMSFRWGDFRWAAPIIVE